VDVDREVSYVEKELAVTAEYLAPAIRPSTPTSSGRRSPAGRAKERPIGRAGGFSATLVRLPFNDMRTSSASQAWTCEKA